jgi:hypothetical protein
MKKQNEISREPEHSYLYLQQVKHPSFVWRIPVVDCMNVEIFGVAIQEQLAGDMN